MAPAGRKSVALISAFDAPFISDDAAILSSENFDIRRLNGSGPVALLKAVLAVFSADVVFCWFLSVYGAVALLAGSLLGRRSVLALGGVDVARDRDLGYGLWLSPWKSALARGALRKADRVLVVAEHLREEAVRLADYAGGNIRYLPTGYDTDFWSPSGPDPAPSQPRRGRVLCVASVDDAVRLKVKGIDVLVEAARLLPEMSFTVVGVNAPLSESLEPPANVNFLPKTGRSSLLDHYRGAKVYCQPSRREGLPNALCEAMLCGCVPVATDAGASAHAVGETGFIAPSGDPGALASAIRRANDLPEGHGRSARDRIADLFSAGRRRAGLLAIFEELSGDPPHVR